MRGRMVRGAAVAALLVMVAAGCSSSSKNQGDAPPFGLGTTTTTLPGSTVSATTTPGTGIVVTTPGGSIVTTPGGTAVTTPVTPPPTAPTGPPTTAAPNVIRWILAADYRSHPGANPFSNYVGGPPVWSLLESSSLRRDGNYTLLPNFSSNFGVSGIAAWHASASGCNSPPSIAVNNTLEPLTFCGVTMKGGVMFVYPSATHMPVVGWKSPFSGTIKIRLSVADLDPNCGDGVGFYVYRGNTPLSVDRLLNRGATELAPMTTQVSSGESVYFIVDAGPSGDTGCDTTQLQVQIDKA